jgi:hypothetical protein
MLRRITAVIFLGCLGLPAQTQPPAGYPKTLQICASACAILDWAGGHYEVMARDGIPATTYTIESFTPQSVRLLRTELPHSGDYGLTATYRGSFEDGAESAHGSVDFTWPGHPGFPHSGSWTATALEPTGFLFLDPNRPCETFSFRGTGDEAAARGALALQAKDHARAACWLRFGAQRGNANAQGLLAAILYMGALGVPHDFHSSAQWAQKAADQGNYLGELALSAIYSEGKALPKDPQKAAYWNARAKETQTAAIEADRMEREQRQRERQMQAQAMQARASQGQWRNNAVSLLLLGLLVGAIADVAVEPALEEAGSGITWNQAYVDMCQNGTGTCAGLPFGAQPIFKPEPPIR